MLKARALAFCCYVATDLARARVFHEGVLGLRRAMVGNTPHCHWVEYEFGQHALAIGWVPGWKPSPDGCTSALELENFAATIGLLRPNKVSFRTQFFASPWGSGRIVPRFVSPLERSIGGRTQEKPVRSASCCLSLGVRSRGSRKESAS
jgi:hypothetical protein